MTLEIELGPELKDRLQYESARLGQPVDSVVIHLLNEHVNAIGIGIDNFEPLIASRMQCGRKFFCKICNHVSIVPLK